MIEGYKTAFAFVDILGNTHLDISHNTEKAGLIASFHRDKSKSSRTIPKWDPWSCLNSTSFVNKCGTCFLVSSLVLLSVFTVNKYM